MMWTSTKELPPRVLNVIFPAGSAVTLDMTGRNPRGCQNKNQAPRYKPAYLDDLYQARSRHQNQEQNASPLSEELVTEFRITKLAGIARREGG